MYVIFAIVLARGHGICPLQNEATPIGRLKKSKTPTEAIDCAFFT
jgi:hypothetical protein